MAIIFLAISGYLLMAISGYYIYGYWWLFVNDY